MKGFTRRIAATVLGLMLGFSAWAGLETVTHISDLNASWPLGSDLASTSDDHIRNIKTALKTDFPNINAAVTGTPTQFNNLTGSTASAPGFTVTGSTVPANGIYLPSANTLGFSSASISRGTIDGSGRWSIVAPSAGVALTVNGVSNANATSWSDGTRTAAVFLSNSSPNVQFGSVSNHALGFFVNNGTPAVTLATTGALSVAAATAAISFTTTGAANKRTALFSANSTSSQSFGIEIDAGTNSSDEALAVFNQAAGTEYFSVRGDGAIQGRGTTAAALVDMTPDTGTFTATYTGMTAGTTCTATWSRVGKLVTLLFCAATGTSNSNAFTMTGLPAAIQPASLAQSMALPANAVMNSGAVGTLVSASVAAGSGTVTFYVNGAAAGWTASGSKGFQNGSSVSYLLN